MTDFRSDRKGMLQLSDLNYQGYSIKTHVVDLKVGGVLTQAMPTQLLSNH